MEMFLKLAAAAWFLFRDSKNQSANPTPALATPQPMPTAVNAGVQGTPNPNLGTPGTQLAGTPNIPRTLPVVGAMMFQGPTLLTGPTDTSNGQLPAAVAVFPEPAKPLPVVVRYLPQPAPPEPTPVEIVQPIVLPPIVSNGQVFRAIEPVRRVITPSTPTTPSNCANWGQDGIDLFRNRYGFDPCAGNQA